MLVFISDHQALESMASLAWIFVTYFSDHGQNSRDPRDFSEEDFGLLHHLTKPTRLTHLVAGEVDGPSVSRVLHLLPALLPS